MQPNPYQSMNYNIQQAYPQYGYNPYFQQTRMQQPQIEQVQPVNQLQQQMPRGVNGRVVQSVEMITANDVPMDGSAAFFPMQDMSAIFAKSWNADGRFAPKGRGTRRGYTEPPYYFQTPDMYHEWDSKSDAERGRDLDRMGGRMYYTEPTMSGYDKAKRHYTESKEMHKGNSQSDKEQKMRDLEAYMKELSGDVTEILSDMTPEERTLLKAKMTTLLQKIG